MKELRKVRQAEIIYETKVVGNFSRQKVRDARNGAGSVFSLSTAQRRIVRGKLCTYLRTVKRYTKDRDIKER